MKKNKFYPNINGKRKELIHYPRHKPNARRVSQLRFEEHQEEKGIKLTKRDLEIYGTGFNMGYKHGRKRYLSLEKKESEAEQ